MKKTAICSVCDYIQHRPRTRHTHTHEHMVAFQLLLNLLLESGATLLGLETIRTSLVTKLSRADELAQPLFQLLHYKTRLK